MKHSKKRMQRENREVWAQRYQGWQASGLSQTEYCKQHGINVSSFYNWSYLFRKSPPTGYSQTNDSTESPSFIPVHLHQAPGELTVRCGDVALSCPDTLSAEQLYHWVKALRRAVCSQ